MSDIGNGKEQELPDRRKAAVAAGLEQYNHIADERDKFEAECRELRTQIAGYKVALEADASRITELESRAQTMMLARDQAVADRAAYEALFVSIFAQMRAFNIPAAPFVRDKSEEADRALDQNARAPAGLDHRWLNVGQRTDKVPEPPRSS